METTTRTKVADLCGADLDYWVAKAGGEYEPRLIPDTMRTDRRPVCETRIPAFGRLDAGRWSRYHPSLLWEDGGPIIEREGITCFSHAGRWEAMIRARTTYDGIEGECEQEGTSALIAAMRCYVESKFGDEVGG